jgi:O-antigen ligase
MKILFQSSKYILLLTLLITPFLVCGYNEQSPFEMIKMVVACIATLIAAVLFLLSHLRSGEITIKWNKGILFLFPVLFATALSYFFSNSRFDSWWGNVNIPSDSLLTTIVYFIFCFLVSQMVLDEDDVKKFNSVLVAAAVLLAGYGVVQHFGGDPVDWWGYRQWNLNAYGTIGQAVGFASILGTLLPLAVTAYFAAKKKGLRKLLLVSSFTILLGLMYSGSRMPTIVTLAVAGLTVAIYLFKFRTKEALKKSAWLIAALLLTQAIYYGESIGGNNRNALTQKFKPAVVSTGLRERFQVWNDAVKIWEKYPVLGTGPEHFALELKLVNTRDFNTNQNWGLYWHKAHNDLIHFLATIGIIGLLAHLIYAGFVAFLIFQFVFLKKTEEKEFYKLGFLFGFAFLFLANLTAFNFVLTQLYAFLFPVLYVVSVGQNRTFTPHVPRILISANLVLISLLFMLFGYEIFTYWNADHYFSLSRRALEADKNMAKAMEYIDKAIATKDNDCRFYLRKASLMTSIIKYQAHANPGMDMELGLRELDDITKQALKCDEHNPESWFYRARLFADLYEAKIEHTIDRAEQGFMEGAKYSPANPVFPYNLGLLYMLSSRWVAFINRMNDAIYLKPDYMMAYGRLYEYYYREKNQPEIDKLTTRILNTQFISSESLRDLLEIVNLAQQNGDRKTVEALVPVYNKFSEQYRALEN